MRPVARRLRAVLFVLVLIAVPVVEVFVFIEVGLAIGWLLATVLLIGTSLVGVRCCGSRGALRSSGSQTPCRSVARPVAPPSMAHLGSSDASCS